LRTRLYYLILITLLLAIGLPAIATTAGGQRPFFFFVLADPQFGMYTRDKGFARETKNLETAIAAANRLHPAFVAICGDLVNQPGNASEIAGFQQVVRRLDPTIPLHLIAGNHDVGNAPTPSSLRAYRQIFGRDYYSFHLEGMEGLVIDSQLIKDGTHAPEAAKGQQQWLLARLAQARTQHVRPLVVFQHIPWFLKNAREKNNYFNIPMQTRLEYLGLLHRFGVQQVFAGHYHQNARGTYRDLKVATIGPVGKPLAKDPSGFEIVTVRNNTLSCRYVPLSSAGTIPSPLH
jgi:3',5'-cyclic AMP phosphodiesterase CpdA